MIYLEIFLCFVKIGFAIFGGISMVPLITNEMLSYGWMSQVELNDIIAIAEMTPGPLGLNCASFAGMKIAGLVGATMANLGALVPTFTIGAIAFIFLNKFKNNKILNCIMLWIRPICIGMILGVSLSFSLTNYLEKGRIDLIGIFIGIVDCLLLVKMKMSIPLLIGLNALIGLLLFSMM